MCRQLAAIIFRPLEDILTLTSSTVEAIPVGRFMGLLLDPPTALYCMYLMGQQRQRADRLYAAVAGLDA